LKTASEEGSTVRFAPISLERLIDSPVIAGEYFRRFAIAPEVTPSHFMDIVADAPEDLKTTPQQEAALSNLVYESSVLFGSHHFEHYDFLVTLSNKMMPRGTAIGGQEHHESSDDIGSENVFRDPAGAEDVGSTLAHEYAHSWNGKYRRPIGEVNANYQVPMQNDLLWVYEGLTTYLGQVLAARSGAWSSEQFREAIANEAASMEYRTGRLWKNLEDTGVSLPTLMNASHGWSSWRRGPDYYPEGSLVWLDVDVTIRTLTHGRKSLDDFCRLFFGPSGDRAPEVLPYSFGDLVKALNSIAANDWSAFFEARLRSKSEHAPLGGITRGGWSLVYVDAPNQFEMLSEKDGGILDALYSIGLDVKQDGSLADVRWGSPADAAGMGPDMKIVDVGGRQFSLAGLKAAIQAAKDSSAPIVLSITHTGYSRRIEIQWHGGERYPALERQAGSSDLLTDITKPLATSTRR
jgi:predicted metalloprotease with PDZ domain